LRTSDTIAISLPEVLEGSEREALETPSPHLKMNTNE